MKNFLVSYLVSYGQILQSLLEVFLNKLFEISLAVYCKIINITSNFVVFFSGSAIIKIVLRLWRNWQTHHLQAVADKTV